MLRKLVHAFETLDYSKDPYVVYIKSRSADEISEKQRKAIVQRKTYCQEQLKTLTNMACIINQDIGPWASEYYIHTCITRFRAQKGKTFTGGLEEREAVYLCEIFSRIHLSAVSIDQISEPNMLTPKVLILIDLLVNEMEHDFSGIIFVQTRASVYILTKILSLHPKTKNIARIGTFVGASGHWARQSNIADLSHTNAQSGSLEDLRSGKKNIIISTSVSEEGIDIKACNAVICFEAPQNLKSFIQRRGRARSVKSKYIIMFPKEGYQGTIGKFEELEEEMKQRYMDDMRALISIQESEESEDGHKTYEIENSGAKLMLSDAIQHLYHFCNSLTKVQYATLEPIFTFQWIQENEVSCKILLPNCIDASLRESNSSTTWRTERLARMDAAFEACISLHTAGLLNDNLMPKLMLDEDAERIFAKIEKRPNIVKVDEQINPWSAVAKAWQSKSQLYHSKMMIPFRGHHLHMVAITPVLLEHVSKIPLFWDAETRVEVEVNRCFEVQYDEAEVQIANEITSLLLYSTFRTRMSRGTTGFPVLFVPEEPAAQEWNQRMQDTYHASALLSQGCESVGLIRNIAQNGKPHVYYGIEHRASIEELDNSQTAQLLKVRPLTKRADWLHPLGCGVVQAPQSFTLLDPAQCEVDALPETYAHFSLFIPSIMHRIKISLIVNDICETILAPVNFNDRNLVLTALSTPVARETEHYQRLEFLGDSILKFSTALTVMAEKPNCPEGYLSSYKDHIVSNKTLSVAAKEVGLDRYILTSSFTGAKWRPLYNDNLLETTLEQSTTERELSTKTLADVVEAIIGAACLDGGDAKVLATLKIFSLKAKWVPFQKCVSALLSVVPSSQILPESFRHLESLIGHSFTHSSLVIEALTHPSCISKDTPSYQRLEFLGDVVLDRVVTHHIFSHASNLQPTRMHHLRAAAVNAYFLAFLALSHSVSIPMADILPIDLTRKPQTVPSSRQLTLPHFLLHAPNPALSENLRTTITRFEAIKSSISSCLASGSTYPWIDLLDFSPEKLISDLVESTLGAIYLDTKGDLAACERWLEKLGVLPWLRRAMDDGVKIWHPKEELGVCAVAEKVRYEGWMETSTTESAITDDVETAEESMEQALRRTTDPNSERWRCRVYVGERDLGMASGRSRIIAEVKAAGTALEILRSEGKLMTEAEVSNKNLGNTAKYVASLKDDNMDIDVELE